MAAPRDPMGGLGEIFGLAAPATSYVPPTEVRYPSIYNFILVFVW